MTEARSRYFIHRSSNGQAKAVYQI